MKEQDYENKKRECWLNTANYCGFAPANRLVRTAFDSAFDCAYALGKQEKEAEIVLNKWHDISIKPTDTEAEYIVRTDMGYIFQAVYTGTEFLVSSVRNDKVYFEKGHNDSLVEWMQVVNPPVDESGPKETVIQGWVARDRYNDLFLYTEKPHRINCGAVFGNHTDAWSCDNLSFFPLDNGLFQDLTWESNPIEVELTIKRKNNG